MTVKRAAVMYGAKIGPLPNMLRSHPTLKHVSLPVRHSIDPGASFRLRSCGAACGGDAARPGGHGATSRPREPPHCSGAQVGIGQGGSTPVSSL